jgi:peptide deformylase
MAIRKVARMGHPVLRQPARPLTREELKSPELQRLVADMVDTMREYGGIGLAAPQIHESVQLALIELEPDSARYPELGSQPLSVYVNPVITVLAPQEQAFWEGCLSIPELRGLVHRPRKIRVDFWDLDGQERSVTAEGFLATVFQHELDHLAGRLFVDRVQDPRNLAFLEEYERYHAPSGKPGEAGELGE